MSGVPWSPAPWSTEHVELNPASRHAQTPEKFWIPIQIYAADGDARPNCGDAPFRQPCPAYPSTNTSDELSISDALMTGRKAPQARFSEEVSGFVFRIDPETRFSKAQAANFSARTITRQDRSTT